MKTFLQKVDFFNRHQDKYRLTFRQDLSHKAGYRYAYCLMCEELATGTVKLLFNFNSSHYPTLDRVDRRFPHAYSVEEYEASLQQAL